MRHRVGVLCSDTEQLSPNLSKRMKVVSGRQLWELQIHGKGDEMWFGVTTDQSITRSSFSMLSQPKSWSYYGGRERSIRRARAGDVDEYDSLSDGPFGALHSDSRLVWPKSGQIKSYSAGDTVAALIDVPHRTMHLFHNGEYQATFDQLPQGVPLFFFVELDDTHDKFTLTVKDPSAAPPFPESLPH